jgi:Protein C10
MANSITNDTAKTILIDILKSVNLPENAKRLAEAKLKAGKEMIKIIQHVFPLIMEIQKNSIEKYGFSPDRPGLIDYSRMIRELERDDAEIARLRAQIRSIYLPPIVINSSNDILI